MTQVIIYQNDSGGMAVIYPAINSGMTVEEIAAKDVPTGKPYKIVDILDIPSDRSNRDGWEVNVVDLTDGVGQ